MSGESASVKIYARLRKLMPWEKKKMSVTAPDEHTVVNQSKKGSHSYQFQNVFGMTADNQFLCDNMVLPMVDKVLEGYNAVLIAYGQTGAGKTHSLVGKPEQDVKGVLPMALETLLQAESVTELSLSAVEAYGTHVSRIELFDLYSDVNTNMNWNEKSGNGSLKPRAATQRVVVDVQQCWDMINQAHDASHFAPTGKNPESSRGHVAFVARVKQVADGEEQVSYFVVVDLAGSEGESAFTPEFVRKVERETLMARRLEAGCINTGLSQLQVVFNELKVKGKLSNVQGTGLRRILHAFINSNCHISVLFCLSPAINNLGPTTSTLKFAVQCGMVKVKPVKAKKKVNMKQLVEQLKAHIKEQEDTITELNGKIEELNAHCDEMEEERTVLLGKLEEAANSVEATATSLMEDLPEDFDLTPDEEPTPVKHGRAHSRQQSVQLNTMATNLKSFVRAESVRGRNLIRHDTARVVFSPRLAEDLECFDRECEENPEEYDEDADNAEANRIVERAQSTVVHEDGATEDDHLVAKVSEAEITARMDAMLKSRQESRMDLALVQSVNPMLSKFPSTEVTEAKESDVVEEPQDVEESKHADPFDAAAAAKGEEMTSTGVEFTHKDTTVMDRTQLIEYCDELESHLIEERVLRVGYHESQASIIAHLQETNEALLRWFQMKSIL